MKIVIVICFAVFSILASAAVSPTIEIEGKILSFTGEIVRLEQKNHHIVEVARILVPKSQKLVVGKTVTLKIRAKINY